MSMDEYAKKRNQEKKDIKSGKTKRIRRSFKDDSRFYIDPDDYTKKLSTLEKNKPVSEELGILFKTHVDRCASANCFKNYTYLDEMKGWALLTLVQYAHNFDPTKTHNKKGEPFKSKKPNGFAYCTTLIHRAFLQVMIREKKHSKLKNQLFDLQKYFISQIDKLSDDESERARLKLMLTAEEID